VTAPKGGGFKIKRLLAWGAGEVKRTWIRQKHIDGGATAQTPSLLQNGGAEASGPRFCLMRNDGEMLADARLIYKALHQRQATKGRHRLVGVFERQIHHHGDSAMLVNPSL